MIYSNFIMGNRCMFLIFPEKKIYVCLDSCILQIIVSTARSTISCFCLFSSPPAPLFTLFPSSYISEDYLLYMFVKNATEKMTDTIFILFLSVTEKYYQFCKKRKMLSRRLIIRRPRRVII